MFMASCNHKEIAIVYAMIGMIALMMGWTASIIMRFELARSGAHVICHESPNTYNMLITLHGITMIFFFVMPFLFGAVANLAQPLMVLSGEVAFPTINNLSMIVLVVSIIFILTVITGEFMAGIGWVMYPPLSTAMMSLSEMSLLGLTSALLINGTSSTLTSTNFIGILLYTKAVGAGLHTYPITIGVVSFLLLASLPSLTGGLIMLMSDVLFNTTFFAADFGGDVLFWQHLFWIFGHPEVYVLILPGFGVVSMALEKATGTAIFGTVGMIAGVTTIAALGLVVWAHHMYVVGMEADARAYFAAATFTIAIPSGLKILHWIGHLASLRPIRSLVS